MSGAQKLTHIYADTIGEEVCKAASCRKRIFFATIVKSGARHPFASYPVALQVQQDLVDGGREVWTVDLATSHFADCPASKQFSRRSGGSHAGR